MILSALCDLAEITGDRDNLTKAGQIAEALIQTRVSPKGKPPTSGVDSNNILAEFTDLGPDPGADNCQFKGIFVRNLAYLYTRTRNSMFSAVIMENAASALRYVNGSNQFGNWWDAPVDTTDFVRQTSALDLLNAALTVSSP